MCGIAGWIDWERDLTREQATLEAMQKTLANRGPDAEGMWVSTTAALVHRRLIVVDPEGGTAADGQATRREMLHPDL